MVDQQKGYAMSQQTENSMICWLQHGVGALGCVGMAYLISPEASEANLGTNLSTYGYFGTGLFAGHLLTSAWYKTRNQSS
jgi:hypothetical protein